MDFVAGHSLVWATRLSGPLACLGHSLIIYITLFVCHLTLDGYRAVIREVFNNTRPCQKCRANKYSVIELSAAS